MIIKDVSCVKKQIMIKDVIFNEEIYARIEPDPSLISKYEENAEAILNCENKIAVSRSNILIDGYHRLKAFDRVWGKEKIITVIMHDTDNSDYIEMQSYAANTQHGNSNSKKENKRNVSRLYMRGFTIEQIQENLSLSKSLVYEATKEKRENEKEERNKKIIDEYLRAWNTQDVVAEKFGVSEGTMNNILNNSIHGKIEETFKPLLYNIWDTQAGNETNHFGSFPAVFMENLLYYHTKPLDIIYDPFAGSGTTVDACRKWFRRYYCSDMAVKPGREKNIVQHNIQTGLPEDLQKPALVFLDPPYWKQAENKYSKSENDLGNMTLETFYDVFQKFLIELMAKKVKKIAIVIQPTQYKNDFVFEDHIFKFNSMLQEKYNIGMRYILPYSTQQYTPQVVDIAKKKQRCLTRNRDLVVWEIKT